MHGFLHSGRGGRWLRWPLLMLACLRVWGADESSWSIARVWDEETLAAIRVDLPNPPVHARNLFHLSAAMYDAWAAYDPVAIGYLYREKATAADPESARREAISVAAYRILTERYALSRNSKSTLARLNARMTALGFDPSNTTTDPTSPTGVGNRVAAAVSGYFLNDGALQSRGYRDLPVSQGGYAPINLPLIVVNRGTYAANINRWQPLVITNGVSQNNIPVDAIQAFLGSQWLGVRPFALERDDPTRPWIDPGPQPQLGGDGDARFREDVVEIIRRSSELDPDDGVMTDISPGSIGNNDLGENNGTGRPINPFTGLPYPPNPVRLGDFSRVLAEFWADGPNSETPPGHWNVIANEVADHPGFLPRIGGLGPVLSRLEWDVKVYFAMNAALHDAACAAWSLKRVYDGSRPITMIRFMGQLGQSSNPGGPSYHRNGLPLIQDLIELVTSETHVPGGRHAGFLVGKVVVRSWPGQPNDPTREHSGVRWVRAADWIPYQKKTFVTPAFPGYVSGHSTFSRAAAEVLAAMTGSEFFPGGMASRTVSTLGAEEGPSSPVTLQWATYFDAADQAGLSRLWGGIHVPVDDVTGRRLGAQAGRKTWALAREYFDGTVGREGVAVPLLSLQLPRCELRFPTRRGFYYRLQSSDGVNGPFADLPDHGGLALDSSERVDLEMLGDSRFFRVVESLRP